MDPERTKPLEQSGGFFISGVKHKKRPAPEGAGLFFLGKI